MKMTDVCILGNGPAGCMAAIGAKRQSPDASVMVIAPDNAPYRIGEALLTGTVYTLAAAKIADRIATKGYHQKIGAAYVWGQDREPWYVDYPAADSDWPSAFVHNGLKTSIHVPRDEFDQQLRDIAKDLGVLFLDDKPESVKIKEGRVMNITTEKGQKIVARHYIDATGQAAYLAKRVTTRDRVWNPRNARYGHIKGVDWKMAEQFGFDRHRTNIISHDQGWFWVIDLSHRGTSVGFVLDAQTARFLTPDNASTFFPSLKVFGIDGLPGLMTPEGVPTRKLVGHPDWSYVCEELNDQNWSLVGDAALFLDPILSQGVTLAMHYGFMRGVASVAHDPKLANDQVTKHYRTESAVLKSVIEQWYGNNRSVKNWHSLTSEIDGSGKTPVHAFQSITNLENIRSEYAPFGIDMQQHIEEKLGVKP